MRPTKRKKENESITLHTLAKMDPDELVQLNLPFNYHPLYNPNSHLTTNAPKPGCASPHTTPASSTSPSNNNIHPGCILFSQATRSISPPKTNTFKITYSSASPQPPTPSPSLSETQREKIPPPARLFDRMEKKSNADTPYSQNPAHSSPLDDYTECADPYDPLFPSSPPPPPSSPPPPPLSPLPYLPEEGDEFDERNEVQRKYLMFTAKTADQTIEEDAIKDELSSTILPEMKPFMRNIVLPATARTRRWKGLHGVIYAKDEDPIFSDCDVIVHCCNCFHTMGTGIAARVKAVFPLASTVDRRTPRGQKTKLGHYSWAMSEAKDKTVINLYGQFQLGKDATRPRNLNYAALYLGLYRMAAEFRKQGVYPKIGTYYMGCFHAGGDKSIVLHILNKVFCDMPIFLHTSNFT